jgi:hypothetical protein
MNVVAEHIKIGLIVALAMTAAYQWLRADSAIGYAEGLLNKLKVAQHDIRKLEQRVFELETRRFTDL